MCKFLCGCKFSVFLGLQLGVGHAVTLGLPFRGTAGLSSTAPAPLHTPLAAYERSNFVSSSPMLLIFRFLF